MEESSGVSHLPKSSSLNSKNKSVSVKYFSAWNCGDTFKLFQLDSLKVEKLPLL